MTALFLIIAAAPCASLPDICVGSEALKVPVVYGRVVYSRKGGAEEPIPDAIVQVSRVVGDELQFVGIDRTDRDGYFHIKDIPYGSYEISAKAEVFRSWSAKLKVTKASKARKIEKQIIIGLEPLLPGACGNARVEMIKSK